MKNLLFSISLLSILSCTSQKPVSPKPLENTKGPESTAYPQALPETPMAPNSPQKPVLDTGNTGDYKDQHFQDTSKPMRSIPRNSPNKSQLDSIQKAKTQNKPRK